MRSSLKILRETNPSNLPANIVSSPSPRAFSTCPQIPAPLTTYRLSLTPSKICKACSCPDAYTIPEYLDKTVSTWIL